ncbi:hypothetical protein CDAR_366921 [Caerostris darwini]|uniref:Secreted protein n=1 Tax=Caerostris darwini TaxID=1538125 RepID=A0AAV4N6Z0_9ARAC|nr:hypothetical protein CDAR_366921 [Caerostris darwini]
MKRSFWRHCCKVFLWAGFFRGFQAEIRQRKNIDHHLDISIFLDSPHPSCSSGEKKCLLVVLSSIVGVLRHIFHALSSKLSWCSLQFM